MGKFFAAKAIKWLLTIFVIAIGLRLLADVTAGSILHAPVIALSHAMNPIITYAATMIVIWLCLKHTVLSCKNGLFPAKSEPAKQGGGKKKKGK